MSEIPTFYRPAERIPGWVTCDWCRLSGELEENDWHDEHCPVAALESELAQAQADVEALLWVIERCQAVEGKWLINATQAELDDIDRMIAALPERLMGAARNG